jgi:hypothetical protein
VFVTVVNKSVASFCVTPYIYINTEVSKEVVGFISEVEDWGAVKDRCLRYSDRLLLYQRTEWQEVRFVRKSIIIYIVKCSKTCHNSICNVSFVYVV